MSHLTRQETLTVLAATGIEFPPATKLPDDALRKRLQQALNGAQSASRVLKGALLDPASLSQWSNSRAHESMGRNNLLEAYQLSQGMEVPLYENPMLDARQTIMALAKAWDDGFKWALIQDQAQQAAICVRVRLLHPFSYSAFDRHRLVGHHCIGGRQGHTSGRLAIPP